MDDETDRSRDGGRSRGERVSDGIARVTDEFVHAVELVVAAVFAFLFAIGVVDLVLQIAEGVETGNISDPTVVIGFIDTGLLLLIIVEVYETVMGYIRKNETRYIVRMIIYTGIIAMIRKVIIFRTGDYGSAQDALLAAGSYTLIVFGLVALLLVDRAYSE